jgi:hypothetical protein
VDQSKFSCPEDSAARLVTWRQALIDNLPYFAMILLGAAIFWVGTSSGTWQWILSGGYVVYGVAGALWIMIFVCPWCHFYDTSLCPCGYGRIAARLRPKKECEDFSRRFKRHIPAIVPLWLLPAVAGGISIFREFSWLMSGLLAAFALNSYVLLPLLAKHYGCASCPQKDTCPWMGGCR